MQFSILNRPEQLNKIANTKFDVVIIGGGVTGAGIALDASSKGMNVCLIEKNDFASGTSNKSTKLIHGGLRYLKQLEFGLVKESGTERRIVHSLAPHLVVPEKMLLPLSKGGGYGKFMTSIGLKIYDFLANVTGGDKRKMLNKKQTLDKEPLLNEANILGSGYYAEYRTDDGRLTLEILKKANEMGATIINYCEMESFDYTENAKIKNLNCIDINSQEKIKIEGQSYVSATGPWVDTIRKKDNSISNKFLHLTKGVHIVFPYKKLPVKQSIYFDVKDDDRMIFAIPRGRCTYVGTTDTNYFGNLNRVVVTKKDAEYLLKAINHSFKGVDLTLKDIESNWTGLRPLIHEKGKDPSELSRKDEIFISNSGLISIAGGKLTGYRRMAKRVIRTIINAIPSERKAKLKESSTRNIALVTPLINSNLEVISYQKELTKQLSLFGIEDTYFSSYLCSTFGKNADIIIKKSTSFKDKSPEKRLIRAELWYCVNFEMTNSIADFFVRRTARLYFDIESVFTYMDIIIEDFKEYLSWSEERVVYEKKVMKELIQDATSYYDKEFE